MKVYLIRHAQSEENILDLRAYTTISDFNELLRRSYATPLTPLGEAQARSVVRKLSGASIKRLYTSPFARTLATATAIGDALGLIPNPEDDLREVLPPPMHPARRAGSLRRLFVQSYLEMFWPWGEGESWLVSYRRAQSVWGRLTHQVDGDIAIVSHRGLISLILLSLRRGREWQIMTQDISNGGVSLVVRQD